MLKIPATDVEEREKELQLHLRLQILKRGNGSETHFLGCFDFTWKQFLIFFKISGFNCETMDPPVQESFEVPGREEILRRQLGISVIVQRRIIIGS